MLPTSELACEMSLHLCSSQLLSTVRQLTELPLQMRLMPLEERVAVVGLQGEMTRGRIPLISC